MDEEYYAQLDNILMEELNIKSVARTLCIADNQTLSLVINHGDSKYHFELGYVRVSSTTEESLRSQKLIFNILNRK